MILRQKPGDGAAHAGGDRAGQDRSQAQCRDLAAPFGDHRAEPADEDAERPEISKAAQPIGQDQPRLRVERALRQFRELARFTLALYPI